MADENNIGTDNGQSSAGTLNAGHEQEHMIPKSRFDEVNNALKDMRAQLEQLRQERQSQEEQRLKENQQFKELAEKYKAELEGLKPQADLVNDYRTSIQQTVDAQIERLPEDMRGIVPKFDDPRKTLEWLNASAQKLVRPAAPNMDAGARGESLGNTRKLTPDQRDAARSVGMTEERYAELLAKLEGER